MRISDWSSDVCSSDLVKDRRRFLEAQHRERTVVLLDRDRRELVLLDDTEANAGVGLVFLLEVVGEGLIALGRDHRERVDLEATQPFTLLVDAPAQAATDGLAAFPLRADFTQSANLEHVGIVPALFQGGVGKDELDLRLQDYVLFIVVHTEVLVALRSVS